jgi:hypothetical protein
VVAGRQRQPGEAQTRYLEFLKPNPSLATRVPQRMVASYLRVSPETIGRIRRKLAKPSDH